MLEEIRINFRTMADAEMYSTRQERQKFYANFHAAKLAPKYVGPER